jgi:gliding motility-associated-like protein
MVYTTHFLDKYNPFKTSIRVGPLPQTDGWRTDSISFVPRASQIGHDWLILHVLFTSGIVLGDCGFEKLPANFLGDTVNLCDGQSMEATMPSSNPYHKFNWNTGQSGPTINISSPGDYIGSIEYGLCTTSDTLTVIGEDCEVRLVMPNIFTPNDDEYNPIFKPIDYNYLEKGNIFILNRWGEEVFRGDLFVGWNGKVGKDEASSGIYFFRAIYTDLYGSTKTIEGPLTLSR